MTIMTTSASTLSASSISVKHMLSGRFHFSFALLRVFSVFTHRAASSESGSLLIKSIQLSPQ